MNIQNISTEQRKVTVELTADDLSMICNALCTQSEEKKHRDDFMQLYSDMILVRNLCHCGRIDDFCLRNIVKCRNNLKGILSDEDITTFNTYLEDNDLPTAFENSDFVRIYKRITGDIPKSDTLKSWMKQNE